LEHLIRSDQRDTAFTASPNQSFLHCEGDQALQQTMQSLHREVVKSLPVEILKTWPDTILG